MNLGWVIMGAGMGIEDGGVNSESVAILGVGLGLVGGGGLVLRLKINYGG